MDADTAVATLHDLDPDFRAMCEALYPGLEPREVADHVFGVQKMDPTPSDVHVPSPVWRNGRGDTKNRGRRKMDNTVRRTVHLKKAMTDAQRKRERKLATVGLAGGSIATLGGAHALAMQAGKTRREARALRTGAGRVPEVSRVRVNPKTALIAGGVGWGALHGTELAADVLGMRAQRKTLKETGGITIPRPRIKPPKLPKGYPKVDYNKALTDDLAQIVSAYRSGQISKAQALELGKRSTKKWTLKQDIAWDKAHGIKQGSPTDQRLDRQRGLLHVKKAHSRTMTIVDAVNSLNQLAAVGEKPERMKPGPFHPAPGPSNKPNKKGEGKKKPALLKKDVDESAEARRPPQLPDSGGLEITGEITKLDDERQQCFGWASRVKVDGKSIVDKQNDMIDIDDIEKAAYDYVQHSRKGGNQHKRAEDGQVHQVAEMIESMVFTPEKIEKMGLPEDFAHGWWIGLQVHDPDTWAEVKNGKRTKFSIHGTGARTEVMVDD